MKQLLILLFTLLVSVPQCMEAADKMLAFPSAEGYGKYVTGGRGGEVCYVTRLDDCSDSNLVPGTLRWALRHNNGGKPRTVLFNVSGTIYLTSKLKLQYPDVSILGQTAPGGGITITGYNMYICRDNVIVRYLRFRAGDVPSTSMTGLDIENADGVILDHCSMTWSMEECLTAYDTDSTTVQWCIIGEGLYNSKNSKGARAYATQWGGEHSTMHHTLITNSHSRAPRFNGVRSSSNNKGDHDYQVDSEFANNVVFNWSASGNQYGGEYDKATVEVPQWCANDPGYNRVYIINNYYRPGPSTKIGAATARYWCAPSSPYGQWYLNGNKFEVDGKFSTKTGVWSAEELAKVNADNYYGAQTGDASRGINLIGSSFTNYVMQSLPYTLSGMEYETAEEAFNNVVNKAGASLPRYDEVDRRLLDEAAGKVDPQFVGASLKANGDYGIIDSPDDITLSKTSQYAADGVVYNNFPFVGMETGDHYAIDSDADGMPDAYEDAVGLDKNNPADGAATTASGYTNLEIYLNGVADGSLNKADYETSAVPVTPGTSSAPQYITVTYSTDDAEVEGEMPAPKVLPYGSDITIPVNNSLYKEGYTLTAWSGNDYTLYPGQTILFTSDVTLRPVFTKNATTLEQRTAPVVAVFENEDNLLERNGILVTHASIGTEDVDMAIAYMDGALAVPTSEGSYAVVTYADGTSQTFTGTEAKVKDAAIGMVTVVFPYKKAVEGVSGSGDATVTWEWAGTPTAKGAITPEAVEGAFSSVTGAINEDAFTVGSSKKPGSKCVAVSPKAKVSSFKAGGSNYISFAVTPAEGIKFKASNISFKSGHFGTNGGILAVTQTLGSDGKETVLKSAITIARDAYTDVSIDLTSTTLSAEPYIIKVYVYSLDPGKQVGIRDVNITGTWEGTAVPPVTYTVTPVAKPAKGGTMTVTPQADSYAKGKEVTLTATPNNGYNFVGWGTIDGQFIDAAQSITTTVDTDTVLIAHFRALDDYEDIFLNCGPYDAAVRTADELKMALKAASEREDLAERFRIFLYDGTYDFGTTAKTAVPQNTSLIGESQQGVLIVNNPGAVTSYQEQTPVLFIDQNQNNVYMQDLTIRQGRDWASKKSAGQAIALRQRGKQAVYKNVTLQGVQDTYYLNKADASAYFEDCTISGEVDFIYGDGTMFFKNCTLTPLSSAAYITASNAQPGYKGIVFTDCTITGEASAAGYHLGRPWGDSPAVTYIGTRMDILPADKGWGSMTSGLVCRFHEYGSTDASGNALDLSARSLAGCSAAAGSDSPVISAEEAAQYSIDNVFPTWDPQALTRQATAATPVIGDGILSWQNVDNTAIGTAICLNGKVIALTQETSCEVTEPGDYTIRAINAMGGLGEPSGIATSAGCLTAPTVAAQDSGAIYTVAGVRVADAQSAAQRRATLAPGIYIKDKKAFVVK